MKVFEVFDSVKAPEELRKVFRDTEVLKLSASRNSSGVTVHIESERLLQFHFVKELERLLNKEFFSDMGKHAVIAEHYRLSSQYTPASVWEHYYESLSEELGAKSRLYTGFLQQTEIEVSDNRILLRTEDTFINRHVGEEVKRCIKNFDYDEAKIKVQKLLQM